MQELPGEFTTFDFIPGVPAPLHFALAILSNQKMLTFMVLLVVEIVVVVFSSSRVVGSSDGGGSSREVKPVGGGSSRPICWRISIVVVALVVVLGSHR